MSRKLRKHYSQSKIILLLCFYFTYQPSGKSQIANYVANGGFEEYYTCSLPNNILLVKKWRSIDSLSSAALYYSTCPNINNIPLNGFTYQFPKSGNAYVSFTSFCLNGTCNSNYNRNYLRNRLKSPLVNGKIYCVKLYFNILNNSTYGIDGLGVYFGDNNSLDTISKPHVPLTYLAPQVYNPNGNLLIDTMNWSLLTGTFVANGNESNLVIGNFKSNASTNSVMINPTYLPNIVSDFLIDDVSCIDIDLPADAGPDKTCIPGNTVYIGRPQDVGIDDACTWYLISNTNTPIGAAAGITVAPVITTTYVVRQDICGNIKWDTVVVSQTALGGQELEALNKHIEVYPNPANEQIQIKLTIDVENDFTHISIKNTLDQIVQEEEIRFNRKIAIVKITDLPEGSYILSVKNTRNYVVNKRFVINR